MIIFLSTSVFFFFNLLYLSSIIKESQLTENLNQPNNTTNNNQGKKIQEEICVRE